MNKKQMCKKAPLIRAVTYSGELEFPPRDSDGYHSLTTVQKKINEALRQLKSISSGLGKKDFFVGGLPDRLELITCRVGPVQGSLLHSGTTDESALAEQTEIGALQAKTEKRAADTAQRLAKRSSKHRLSAEQVDVELGTGEVRTLTKSFYSLRDKPTAVGSTPAGKIVMGGKISCPTDFPRSGEILLSGCRLAAFTTRQSVLLRFDSVVHEADLRVRFKKDFTVPCYLSDGHQGPFSNLSMLHGVRFAGLKFDCIVSEVLSTKKSREWIFVFERFVDPAKVLHQISEMTRDRLDDPKAFSRAGPRPSAYGGRNDVEEESSGWQR